MSRTELWGGGGVREKGPGHREQDVARLGGGGEGRCGKGFGFCPKGREKPLENYKQVGNNVLRIELVLLPKDVTES